MQNIATIASICGLVILGVGGLLYNYQELSIACAGALAGLVTSVKLTQTTA